MANRLTDAPNPPAPTIRRDILGAIGSAPKILRRLDSDHPDAVAYAIYILIAAVWFAASSSIPDSWDFEMIGLFGQLPGRSSRKPTIAQPLG